MPASIPPELTFEQVVQNTPQSTTSIDFGAGSPVNEPVELGPIRIIISNDANSVAALQPICYVGGSDAEIVGTIDNEWTQMKNINHNGIAVSDTYTPVSYSNTHNYKPMPTNSLEPGTYVTVDAKLIIPQDTDGGQYEWDYILEYMYSI